MFIHWLNIILSLVIRGADSDHAQLFKYMGELIYYSHIKGWTSLLLQSCFLFLEVSYIVTGSLT